MSLSLERGISANGWPVTGLINSTYFPLFGATDSPPMKLAKRRIHPPKVGLFSNSTPRHSARVCLGFATARQEMRHLNGRQRRIPSPNAPILAISAVRCRNATGRGATDARNQTTTTESVERRTFEL